MTSRVEQLCTALKSIPVALPAAVILPGPIQPVYRKKKKKLLNRKGNGANRSLNVGYLQRGTSGPCPNLR